MTQLPSEIEIASALAHRRRLQAVRLSGMLAPGKDERFDRLTRLAARLIDVPATVISIVAENHDFHKSVHWSGDEAGRDRYVQGRTLCHYGLLLAGPLIIEDVYDHAELRQAPVIDALGVRAYLGIPLITDDGEHIGSFCAVDVVRRKWTEKDIEILSELAYSTLREIKLQQTLGDLARNLEVAKHAVQRHEELVATVAHDLLGPLQTIMYSAERMLEATPPSGAITPLERIAASADGMAGLLRHLLDEDPPGTGLVMTEFEVGNILEKARSLMTEIAARKGVRLDIQCEGDLPPINADLADMLRIFGNLIGNAIKFSAADSTVRLTAQRAANHIEFAVIDEGVGIEPEDMPMLFNRAWQGSSHSDLGHGLGLAICKELVERRGGHIHASSTPGRGSTFTFALPLATR